MASTSGTTLAMHAAAVSGGGIRPEPNTAASARGTAGCEKTDGIQRSGRAKRMPRSRPRSELGGDEDAVSEFRFVQDLQAPRLEEIEAVGGGGLLPSQTRSPGAVARKTFRV